MNNTVVTASDMNYFWGVLMLIASMRRWGMKEPVIVAGVGYTTEAKTILAQFSDVTVVDMQRNELSLTCRKPEVMLLAQTPYVTWVDCDGFFHGNCSAALPPENPRFIHIRKRSLTENKRVYPSSETGKIPGDILKIWQKDVGERSEPRLDTCCSACILSIGTNHRKFLERWQTQMERVLPKGDQGVVDYRSKAYFQTDESVLNSLLCYMKEAPEVSSSYKLDLDMNAFFIHFVTHPKPWRGWTKYAFRHFERYVTVAEYLLENHFQLPGPLPYTLKRSNRMICRLLMMPVMFKQKLLRLKQKLTR